MSGPPPAPADEDNLSIQVGAGGDEPERLLLVSRPKAGRVRIREWTSDRWSAEPDEYVCEGRELIERLERAARERRRVSEELLVVRRWLSTDTD